MFSAKDIEFEKIDHLGIVAGIVDSIGIVEIINNLLGSEPGEKVSAGQVVKAMILNGLSMMSQPLYMFPKFFELIACEHLIILLKFSTNHSYIYCSLLRIYLINFSIPNLFSLR
jgi:transposase